MPRVDRAARGRAAEDAAAKFLVREDCILLLRNYRCRFGEIDIVARTPDSLLLLVEVRMRSSDAFGGAAASVDVHKQRRVLGAARHLLMMRPQLARMRMRFDVLDMRPARQLGYDIGWIRDAFRA